MVKTKRVATPPGEVGSSSRGASAGAKKTKYETLPVVPEMSRNFQPDPNLYMMVLTDEGEEEQVYIGPMNRPVMSRLYRAEERRWLNKDAHTLYTKWSNSHDKVNYRAVLGGKFIDGTYFISTGLGQLIANLTDMGWLQFTQTSCRYDEQLVRQFYANLYEDNGHYHSVVENQIISFTPAYINQLVGARNEGSEFCAQGTFSDIVDFGRLKDLFPGQPLSAVYKLKMTHFMPIHRVTYALVTEIFCPRGGHKTDMTHMGLHWLMGIWFRVPINLGFFICRYMLESQMEKKHMLPYGRLIMRILQDQRVRVNLEHDVGSKDIMGQDFFKDNHMMLVGGRWLYKQSKMRELGPGAHTDAIYNDTQGPSLPQRKGKKAAEAGPSQPVEQPPEQPNVRTREFKAFHHRLTNVERTVNEMRWVVNETRRMMEFNLTRTWTPDDWHAFQTYQGTAPPAGVAEADVDDDDDDEQTEDDEHGTGEEGSQGDQDGSDGDDGEGDE